MKKTFEYENNPEKDLQSDDHILKINKQVNKVFDESYKFISHNPIRKLFYNIIWLFAALILPVIDHFVYGLKIKGKKNLNKARKEQKGIITIANHCLVMDCTMCVAMNIPQKTWIPTVEETLKIPKVRHIIKALNVLPIPTNPRGLSKFKHTINELLRAKEIVHFYPEGSLWPGYDKLRPFKPGAFRFAYENDCPIVPLCIYFRPRKGFSKFFIKTPYVTIEALPPLHANKIFKPKFAIQDLSDRAYAVMKPVVEQYEIPNSQYRKLDKDFKHLEKLENVETNF